MQTLVGGPGLEHSAHEKVVVRTEKSPMSDGPAPLLLEALKFGDGWSLSSAKILKLPRKKDPICSRCTHYVGGREYSETGEPRPELVCAMHPFGPETGECKDFERLSAITSDNVGEIPSFPMEPVTYSDGLMGQQEVDLAFLERVASEFKARSTPSIDELAAFENPLNPVNSFVVSRPNIELPLRPFISNPWEGLSAKKIREDLFQRYDSYREQQPTQRPNHPQCRCSISLHLSAIDPSWSFFKKWEERQAKQKRWAIDPLNIFGDSSAVGEAVRSAIAKMLRYLANAVDA